MHESVKAAMAKLEEAEAAAAQKVRAAEGSIVDTAMMAAEKVNSEAAEAVAMGRARVEVAEGSAQSAQEAAKHAQEAQMETIRVAERLFSEASASSDLAASAQSEASALQEEVKQLRGEVAKAVQQRDVGLAQAAERQARAVRTVRTAHEMCEHRVQQAQNEFETLKLAERDGARAARDDTERIGECVPSSPHSMNIFNQFEFKQPCRKSHSQHLSYTASHISASEDSQSYAACSRQCGHACSRLEYLAVVGAARSSMFEIFQ